MDSKSSCMEKLFHDDKYKFFKIALDVNETSFTDFCDNVNKSKSKDLDLFMNKLKKKVTKKKNALKDKNSNSVEKEKEDNNAKTKSRKSLKAKRDKENKSVPVHLEEKASSINEKDSELKEKASASGVKKKITRNKKTPNHKSIVTVATNTIHAELDDVTRKLKKSKDARVLNEKENLPICDTADETTKQVSNLLLKKSKKYKVKDFGEELNTEKKLNTKNDSQKTKLKVKLKEKKISQKEKEILIEAEATTSNIPDVEENNLASRKISKKKKNVRFEKTEQNETVENNIHVRQTRSQTARKRNPTLSEAEGKSIQEKKTGVKKKKTQARKIKPLTEGEETTSKQKMDENNEVSKEKDPESTTVASLLLSSSLVTLEDIDPSIFSKNNVVHNDLKNSAEDGSELLDKKVIKPLLTQVMRDPPFSEKNNSENVEQITDKPKKFSVSPFDEKQKLEKPEKKKTSYDAQKEALRKRREIRYEKKITKAMEKLSKYTMKQLKKLHLNSNPSLKQYLDLESNSESNSHYNSDDSSFSQSSSDGCYCSECSCTSECSCSCCSDTGSSYDGDSSSSGSCSNYCSSSNDESAFSTSSTNSKID